MVDNIVMTMTIPAAPTSATTGPTLPTELFVGDLVVWTGKPSQYSSIRHGVIYRIVERKVNEHDPLVAVYRLGTAFEFTNPVGTHMELSGFSGAHELRKLSLLDLGIIRLTFDAFIKEWARTKGAESIRMPEERDINEQEQPEVG